MVRPIERSEGIDRRDLLKFIGAGTATTALAGCTGNRSQGTSQNANAQKAGNTPKLKYWHKETGYKKYMNRESNQFSGADVSTRAIPESKIATQVQSAMATGNLPNVVESSLMISQQLQNGGVLSTKSATNVVKSFGKDTFLNGPLTVCKAADGGYYAVPWYVFLMGLYWREDNFKEKGLAPPTTWENIRKAAEALHDPDNNHYGIGLGTKKNYYTTQSFEPFALSNDARVFNESGDIVFDSKEMIETLKFYAELDRQYGVPGDTDYKDLRQFYFTKQTSLVMWNDWFLGMLQGQSEQLLSKSVYQPFVQRDSGSDKASYGMVITMSLPDVGNQSAAEEFVKYLNSKPRYIKFLHKYPLGPSPTRKPIATSDSYLNCKYCSDSMKGLIDRRPQAVDRIRKGINRMERFGTVNGNNFPEYGQITSQFLIAEAVRRVIDGESADTVAKEQAEKMRQEI